MREIDPEKTKRAAAFKLWIDVPMPMVTLFKTLNVKRLVGISRRHDYKFNMLMCWCVGRAASQMEEFYLLPVGKKLVQYEHIAVNTVIKTAGGDIATCDVPFLEDIHLFNKRYIETTRQVRDTGKSFELDGDYMVIGTSALADYDIDGAVNIYAGIYNNPFLIWGRYRRGFAKITLPISFQFHHTQLDGMPAARFLELLQEEIKNLKV